MSYNLYLCIDCLTYIQYSHYLVTNGLLAYNHKENPSND